MTTAGIYGVGAIGGYLAVRLALSGVTVTGIARGAQLRALRERGLTLIENGTSVTATLRAVENPADAGPQDVVFLTVKAHTLPTVAERIKPLLGVGTAVVTATNGFPWWYFHRFTGGGIAPTLQSVDPRGSLWRLIGPEHAIGCVVYPAVKILEPGVIQHIHGNRFAIGEPDGSVSARVTGVAEVLCAAGLDAPVRQDIRTELWTKLVANAAYNPVSILTGATLGQMMDDLATARLLEMVMTEAAAVAHAVGSRIPLAPRQLMELTRPLGAHKTSMLLDLEAGRTVELEPIAGAIVELARLRGIRTPVLDIILALARQRARLTGPPV